MAGPPNFGTKSTRWPLAQQVRVEDARTAPDAQLERFAGDYGAVVVHGPRQEVLSVLFEIDARIAYS